MRKILRHIGLVALTMVIVFTAMGVRPSLAEAATNFELFTPYRELTAAPGESISYSIDLINNTSATQVADLKMSSAFNWNYDLTAGGKKVQQIAVKAGESQTLNFRLDVPLQIDPAKYDFTISAGDAALKLVVNVAEKGTFQSNFEIEQANMEGYSGGEFKFSATLRNQTAEEQTYALAANPPLGWEVRFQSGGNYVSSVTLDVNASQTINIQVNAPEKAEAQTYTIPIAAYNNITKAETELEVNVIGSYDISLKTADERLNATVQAGKSRTLELIVENTGTALLENINLSAVVPTNWESQFEPKTIDKLEPGQTASVQATITASKDALPGDYAMSISAKTDQKSAAASIRATVKTSVLWGWIGVVIIAFVVAMIYFLFRKYGRR